MSKKFYRKMKRTSRFTISILLAAAICFGACFAAFGENGLLAKTITAEAAETSSGGEKEQELKNIAINKTATATECESGGGLYDPSYLTDGMYGNYPAEQHLGWNTSKEANATIDLGNVYSISRILLVPVAFEAGKFFPSAYKVSVSLDREEWKVVGSASDIPAVEGVSQEITFEAVKAVYVKVEVIPRSVLENNGTTSVWAQLGEVEVYGTYAGEESVSINKKALRMIPGDVDYLKITYKGGGNDSQKITFFSSNPSVATVTADGKVEAVSYGATTIHVAESVWGTEYDVSVLVDDYVATKEFMITAFWPIQNYNMNDDYLDNMKEAGITNIQLNYVLNTANYDDNMTIAQMAYERGMGVTVSEKAWGWGAIANMTDEQIYQEALKYSHVPGVIGYYVMDEPPSAKEYAHCFAPIKKAMPTADAHLNFVFNTSNYLGLLEVVDARDLEYLMWDYYMYPTEGCYEGNFFNCSNETRKLALRYGVKTAQYIQSCGFNGTFRKPNGNEIRYNVNAAIAYGNKQIAYFTYRIPEDVGETFTSAIVNADGTKTEIFDDVAKINDAVLKLGPTLMSVEALEVYHTGKDSGANNPLPEDFFLQPKKGTDLIVSYMRNNDTAQNYVMLVNRDYENGAEASFTVADEITSLRYISQQDGQEKTLAGQGQDYIVSLEAGGSILVKLPEVFDWMPDYGKFVETPARENSAMNENTIVRGGGTNSLQLTDGARISNTYTDGCGLPGYTDTVADDTYVRIDFGGGQTVNRIDLYPGSKDQFPSDFALEGSLDGKAWTNLLEVKDYNLETDTAASFNFETGKYRYLQLNIQKTPSGKLQLCEVETYYDDGTMTALKTLNGAMTVDKARKPADNLARLEGVKILYSDSNEAAPYWQSALINDGVGYNAIGAGNAGWSSTVNRTSATEEAWVGYELGKTKLLDKVIAFNAWDDRGAKKAECFPADYHVDVSIDGETWTTVYSVYNDTNWEQVGARVLEFEAVKARYVRFRGSRLGRCGDGFALQLSELEVYGSDVPEYDSVMEFLGGSLRTDYADYTKTSLRFGYKVTLPEGAKLESWYWDYSVNGQKKLINRKYGENKMEDADGSITTNLVITGIPANCYDRMLYAQLTVTYTLDGKTYTVAENAIQERAVQTVANAILASSTASDAERTYAQGILNEGR